MELELLPAVSLLPETLNVLVAPEEMLARALNGNPHLQQFRILFITGIRSGILSRLDRNSLELIVRRAFISLQLRTILEETYITTLSCFFQYQEKAYLMCTSKREMISEYIRFLANCV